jgi:hypothetical protein
MRLSSARPAANPIAYQCFARTPGSMHLPHTQSHSVRFYSTSVFAPSDEEKQQRRSRLSRSSCTLVKSSPPGDRHPPELIAAPIIYAYYKEEVRAMALT